MILELLYKISYTKSESEYVEAYKDFEAVAVQPAIENSEKPLIINSHRGRDTHTCSDINIKVILRN